MPRLSGLCDPKGHIHAMTPSKQISTFTYWLLATVLLRGLEDTRSQVLFKKKNVNTHITCFSPDKNSFVTVTELQKLNSLPCFKQVNWIWSQTAETFHWPWYRKRKLKTSSGTWKKQKFVLLNDRTDNHHSFRNKTTDWPLCHSLNLSKSSWAVEKSNWNSKWGNTNTQNYQEVQVLLADNNTTNLSDEEPKETYGWRGGPQVN